MNIQGYLMISPLGLIMHKLDLWDGKHYPLRQGACVLFCYTLESLSVSPVWTLEFVILLYFIFVCLEHVTVWFTRALPLKFLKGIIQRRGRRNSNSIYVLVEQQKKISQWRTFFSDKKNEIKFHFPFQVISRSKQDEWKMIWENMGQVRINKNYSVNQNTHKKRAGRLFFCSCSFFFFFFFANSSTCFSLPGRSLGILDLEKEWKFCLSFLLTF